MVGWWVAAGCLLLRLSECRIQQIRSDLGKPSESGQKSQFRTLIRGDSAWRMLHLGCPVNTENERKNKLLPISIYTENLFRPHFILKIYTYVGIYIKEAFPPTLHPPSSFIILRTQLILIHLWSVTSASDVGGEQPHPRSGSRGRMVSSGGREGHCRSPLDQMDLHRHYPASAPSDY